MEISPLADARRTLRRVSIVLGIVGGALDLGVGLLILATGPMASSSAMGFTVAYVGAILLLLLGGVILGSTVQMIGSRKTPRRRSEGLLMFVYGVLMLMVGAAMIGRLFPTMQAPEVSGAAMIGVGLAGSNVLPVRRRRRGATQGTYPVHGHPRPHAPIVEGTSIRARAVLPRDPCLLGCFLRRTALPPRVPGSGNHHPGNPLPSFLVRIDDDGGRRVARHRGQRREVRPRLCGRVRRRGRICRRRGRPAADVRRLLFRAHVRISGRRARLPHPRGLDDPLSQANPGGGLSPEPGRAAHPRRGVPHRLLCDHVRVRRLGTRRTANPRWNRPVRLGIPPRARRGSENRAWSLRRESR